MDSGESDKARKAFLVSDIEYDEEGSVISCKLEAIISKKLYSINWIELKIKTDGFRVGNKIKLADPFLNLVSFSHRIKRVRL